MTAVHRDLYIEQGATFVLSFQWCSAGTGDTPGPAKDITGWIFRMQARQNQQTAPVVALNSTAPTTNGSVITLGVDPQDPSTDPDRGGTADPTNGWVRIVITDDDTDQMDKKTSKYDLEAEDPVTEYVYRLLQGSIDVDPNYTQESDDPVVT